MTGPLAVVTGVGVLSATGTAPVDVTGMYEEMLPHPNAMVMTDFQVRAELGRKGTSFFDRATALTVVACGRALRDITVTPETSPRLGIVFGTTFGSLKSTMDYSRETLVADKPYLVNPVLFPNTVMNCVSGQAAIWFGLRGVNATIAGGPLAFLQALRYALASLRRDAVDRVLVGAVEEFTPNTAWASELTGGPSAGEGAAAFLVERPDRASGPVSADILGTATAFRASDRPSALGACVRRALASAGANPDDVAVAAVGDDQETDAVIDVLGHKPDLIAVTDELGDCRAAGGALGLAAVLAGFAEGRHRSGSLALLTGHSADGAVAAAVVRGWHHGGTDRG